MPDRQYIAVAFRPGDRKSFTYHNDGPPLSIGDRVVVFSRGREQRVSVIALVDQKPPFETKAILRVVDQPPVEKVTPENSTAMLDLPDDEIPL